MLAARNAIEVSSSESSGYLTSQSRCGRGTAGVEGFLARRRWRRPCAPPPASSTDRRSPIDLHLLRSSAFIDPSKMSPTADFKKDLQLDMLWKRSLRLKSQTAKPTRSHLQLRPILKPNKTIASIFNRCSILVQNADSNLL